MQLARLLFLTISAVFVLAAVAFLPQNLCFDSGNAYTFYCGTSSADCKVVTVQNFASLQKLCLKDVCGESTDYDNFDLESFLESVGGKVVFKEEFSDGVNYYCTANLPYSVTLYNHTINLHVAVRGDTARVASPIIFGGY
ncbi:MAG: hypothetical protein K2O89_03945 [Clostridia bacterium]|nr:hypothetical protein [Clostridia bacterium]